MGLRRGFARPLPTHQSLGCDSIAAVIQATPEPSIFERALYDRLPLSRWSSPGGRLLLLTVCHIQHSSIPATHAPTFTTNSLPCAIRTRTTTLSTAVINKLALHRPASPPSPRTAPPCCTWRRRGATRRWRSCWSRRGLPWMHPTR